MKTITLFALCMIFGATIFAQSDCPCCTDDHNAFSFWEGDWVVFQGDKKVGENSIESLEDNCLLRETYTTVNGKYSGTSYNYYNKALDRWEQIWVDNQGLVLHLKGNLVDGSMVLSSDPMPAADGKLSVHKITWTPNKDGTVRQHWESMLEGTDTWSTLFDGLYKPR